ncbi:Autoinducer 2 kinase LsrK [Serratia rubidaea]|uniref:Autoinducer 2 kinase LsrK n=1 Tax=Serratia rubidaea TaxID=61652 RepID=A0A447QR50_SERRU|nr:Autoinducer 2 kinase LsrK [Serratia rubidaea]
MPIFSDAMHFKSWYHAAPSFINMSLDPQRCNKQTLFRALEENAAIVAACNLAQIAQFSGVQPPALVFAGGGAKGRLWSQILSDVTGLPVRVPVVKEAPRWAAPSPPASAPDCLTTWRPPANVWCAGSASISPTRRIMRSISSKRRTGGKYMPTS